MERQPPPRVVANLRVRASAGNLPKTIPTLINALKPHTFVTVFCPPSAVLAHLSLKYKDEPPSISFFWKKLGKFDDKLTKKILSQAQFKARKYNAILEVITSGIETEAAANKLEQSLRSLPSLPFFNQASLYKLITQACLTTKNIDPAVILEQLKTHQLVYTGENGRVTYSIDSPLLNEFRVMQTSAATPVSTTLPSSPHAALPSSISSLSPTPSNLVIAALQCLWRLGNDLPKTEEKLANVLKPICKVVSVCLPATVLEKLDKSLAKKQFYIYEKKVINFSAASMFDTNRDSAKKKHLPAVQGQRRKGRSLKGKLGRSRLMPASSSAIHNPMHCPSRIKEPTKTSRQESSTLEKALIHLKNELLQHSRKVNGSIIYGTHDDIIQTVAKVERWLAQKQSIFERFEANSACDPELMETEASTQDVSSNVSAPWSIAVSTKQKLVHEFFDLCITQAKLDPEEILERLISSGFITIDESGHVSYNLNTHMAQLLASKDASCYVTAERTCIRFLIIKSRVEDQQASLAIAGAKRKHGNTSRRSKKLHFSV